MGIALYALYVTSNAPARVWLRASLLATRTGLSRVMYPAFCRQYRVRCLRPHLSVENSHSFFIFFVACRKKSFVHFVFNLKLFVELVFI